MLLFDRVGLHELDEVAAVDESAAPDVANAQAEPASRSHCALPEAGDLHEIRQRVGRVRPDSRLLK
jgi:hypothetical protein